MGDKEKLLLGLKLLVQKQHVGKKYISGGTTQQEGQ